MEKCLLKNKIAELESELEKKQIIIEEKNAILEEYMKTKLKLKEEHDNLQEILKSKEAQELNLKVRQKNLEETLKSQDAELLKLVDQGMDTILTCSNDETEILLESHRECLLELIDLELDIMPTKCIIAAMKVYSVSEAEEDMKRLAMMSGKKVENKKMIQAFGEVLALSPLHASALLESSVVLRLCMYFDGMNSGNGNILDLALQVGNADIINCVFENAKDSDLVTIENGIPLCLADAIRNNDNEKVDILLKRETFHPALSPLMCVFLAIRHTNLTMFTSFLVQAKTQINSTIPNMPCPLCSAPETTLLHLAICSYKPKFVKLLVQAGCDVNNTKGQPGGYTPLMQAISQVGNHCCRGMCEDRVIAELLSAEGINLDFEAEDKGSKFTAQDLVNNYTCSSSKKLIQQAYVRNNLRKKMLRRRQTKLQADQAKKGSGRKHRREKICWYCSSTEQLSRCAGCRVAWYCGEECQGEDWDVHGEWCVQKGSKRKEKHDI